MGAFDWNCSKCTYHHTFSAQRCTMCGSLRVSRDQMREFVRGRMPEDSRKAATGNRNNSAVSNAEGGQSQTVDNPQRGPLHQNQTDGVAKNPYANRPTSSYGPNSSSAASNPFTARPNSSYRPNSSSGAVTNPYSKRPNSSAGNVTAHTGNDATATRFHDTAASAEKSQNIAPNATTQGNSSLPRQTGRSRPSNPYTVRKGGSQQQPHASSSGIGQSCQVQNATGINNYINNPNQGNNRQSSNGFNMPLSSVRDNDNSMDMSQPNKQSAPNGFNTTCQQNNSHYGTNPNQVNRRMTANGYNTMQSSYGRAESRMNQNPNNRNTTASGYNNVLSSTQRTDNRTNHDPINRQHEQNKFHNQNQHRNQINRPTAENESSHPNPNHNHKRNATVQGLREKPIAPLFRPQTSTSSRSGQGVANIGARSNVTPNFGKSKTPWNNGLPYQEGPVPISQTTCHSWIYPLDEKYPERKYQFEMAQTSIMTNTLVSLPTGLGKTLIAAVVMYNYYRWFPSGKVVFLAPTRPLVTQQIQACYNVMGIPESDTAEISGKKTPEMRERYWKSRRVFFCTPQTLVKDIEGIRCDPRKIVCVVMDEAHRATGAHANTQLVRLITDSGAKYRLVGLSATPGADIKSIQKVISVLNICAIEARTEDDPDVKQYIHHREEEAIVVEQPAAIDSIRQKFGKLINPIVDRLRNENVSTKLLQNSDSLKFFTVYQAFEEYKKRQPDDYRLTAYFMALMELTKIREQLDTNGIDVIRSKLQRHNNTASGYLGKLTKGNDFQSLLTEVLAATHATQDDDQEAKKNFTKNNPKYEKLSEILLEHFNRKQSAGQDTRVIIFSQWRDSVESIVSMLKAQNHSMLKPSPFIGQSKKSMGKKSKSDEETSNDRQDSAGMNQKQQQKVLQQFQQGIYNILVCTCIGEEGLDIGDVDLIVNFDVLKSPIRSIQRNGRTGRKRDGRVVFLVSKGAEKKSYDQSLSNKTKIAKALQSCKSTFEFCSIAPMFVEDPEVIRQKMTKTNFRMSQVGGYTPKAARGSKSVRNKASNTDWVLTTTQQNARHRAFGDLPAFSLHEFDNGRSFPQSLRRDYLKSRERSTTTRLFRSGGSASLSIYNARSRFGFMKELERKHLNNTLSLSPLDEALAKLQSTQKDQNDCISLNEKSSLVFDDSTTGDGYVSFDVEECLTSNTNMGPKSDHLDRIFGVKSSSQSSGIHASHLSFLFDSDEHKNCAVIPPSGYKTMVSTDTSTGNESISDKSDTLSINTTNDDLLCNFFESKRPLINTKNTKSIDEEPLECFDESDFGGGGFDFELDIHREEETDVAKRCVEPAHQNDAPSKEVETNSSNVGDKNDLPPQSSLNNTVNLTNDITTDDVQVTKKSQNNADQQEHLLKNVCDELAKSRQCDRNNSIDDTEDSIVALQLPTPPDSSCESEDESTVEDATHGMCVDEISTKLDKFTVTKYQDTCASEENQSTIDIAPLRLPTQDWSSSSDESDEEASLHCNVQTSTDDKQIQNASECTAIHGEVHHGFPLGNQPCTRNDPLHASALDGCDINQQSNDMRLKSHENDVADVDLNEIVPLHLPTQYSSSSSDDESDRERIVKQGVAEIESEGNNYPFMSLCEDNRNDTEMPPPSSLKNITNIANQFSPVDNLIDTPAASNFNASVPHMSPDDLTDTPVVQPRKITAFPRLSDGLTDTPLKTAEKEKKPKKLAGRRKRLRAAFGDKENELATSTVVGDRQERVKKRIEGKYRCKFLDTEAAEDDSDEESDEEDAIKQIEKEEFNNSFINDSSQLGYSQDELDQLNADKDIQEIEANADDSLIHRQLNHERTVAEQFKTPVFNRRMVQTPSSQNDAPPSQRGLGNMNFIKSVLEHHRQGGDCDDIEDGYHRLLVGGQSPPIHDNIDSPVSITDPPVAAAHELATKRIAEQPTNNAPVTSNHQSSATAAHHLYQVSATATASMPLSHKNNDQSMTLTAEQKAMIEAKRAAALKRRQERMHQEQTAKRLNPYIK